MKETELYEPVRDWLAASGWRVRAEVKGCDVAAMAGDNLILVEMKTSLNLDVILQATDRQRMGDRVYIAVPALQRTRMTKRWKLVLQLLKRLELGLLVVHFPTRGRPDAIRVEEAIPPIPFDRARSLSSAKSKRAALIQEFEARSGDHNRGGSVKKSLVTAYREQALFIAHCLSQTGPTTPRVLRKMGTSPEKTQQILFDNHYGWFLSVSRGIYALTDQGREALLLYAEVLRPPSCPPAVVPTR